MFTPKTLSFLRCLKRNNKREWFHSRRDQFDAHCRAPMVELAERLALDLPAFAAELMVGVKESLFRQFRDTRFREEPGTFATSKDFYKHPLATFQTLSPLVRFLNEPLVAAESPLRKASLDF